MAADEAIPDAEDAEEAEEDAVAAGEVTEAAATDDDTNNLPGHFLLPG